MTHFLFILIGCGIIIITRRLYYKNFELFLCLLIPVNFNFFHLIPRIGPFDQYKESLLLVILFYLFEEYIVRPHLLSGKKPLTSHPPGENGKLIIFYLIILVGGLLIALAHGQSTALSIKSFKFYPLLLTYFLVMKRGLDITKFTHYFLWLAVGIATLAFIQYLTLGSLSIFRQYETALRGLGSERGLRFIEGSMVITIGTIISFVKYIQTHQKRFLFISICLIIHISVVIQTRALLISILLVMLFISFFFSGRKSGGLIKISFGITCGALLITAFLLYNQDAIIDQGIVSQTLNDLQGISSSEKGHGNMQIRFRNYQYHWQELQKTWLTGRGLLNESWVGNPAKYLMERYGYYSSDIGAFHLLVNFGIFGGIFLGIMIFTTLTKLKKLMIFAPEVASYFLLGLIMLPQIDIFFRLDNIFVFSIFMACADTTQASTAIGYENKSLPTLPAIHPSTPPQTP